MDQERFQRWVDASLPFSCLETNLWILLPQLGKIDCQLIAGDEDFLEKAAEQQVSVEYVLKDNDRMTLSYLWVLGAYEFIRTVNQRLRGRKLEQEAREVKDRFNRLRVPLAKMEAARKNPEDSHIAFPSLDLDHGAAWRLNYYDYVTRRELADVFLEFAELFAAEYGAKNRAKQRRDE